MPDPHHTPSAAPPAPRRSSTAAAPQPPDASQSPDSSRYGGLLPAMAALSLYMFLLAAVVGFGAVTGRFPRLFLLLCLLFVAAGAGLARLRRWGWALTAGASFLLMGYGVLLYLRLHMLGALMSSFLNLVFFLYLVRPEVRERLR
jgi:hypothetical protein